MMKMRHVYAALCVPGALLPWSQLLPWMIDFGPDLPLLFRALFVNAVSGAFAIDLIITAMVVTVLVVVEGARSGLRRLWLPVLGTFLIGVSFGLPLFLYMRERQRERARGGAA